jgi:hypothetical protein
MEPEEDRKSGIRGGYTGLVPVTTAGCVGSLAAIHATALKCTQAARDHFDADVAEGEWITRPYFRDKSPKV